MKPEFSRLPLSLLGTQWSVRIGLFWLPSWLCAHYENHAHLALGGWVLPLGLCPPWDPITPTAFKFPNSVTTIPTVSSELQRRAITELFKDAGAPLTTSFLSTVVTNVSSGPSQGGWVDPKRQIHSNIPISLSLWIPPCAINLCVSISNSLTVDHLLVHVSAKSPF